MKPVIKNSFLADAVANSVPGSSGECVNGSTSQRRDHWRFHPRAGFTLIEVLIVITIILVLALLSFTIGGKIKQTAQSSTCISNLRQLGVLVQIAVTDRGEYPPALSQTSDPNGGSIVNTGDHLGSYIDALSCTICPAAKYTGYSPRGEPIGAYGANPKVMGYYQNFQPPLVKPSQIQRPAELMLMSDGAQFAAPNPRSLGHNAAWWLPRDGNPANKEKELTTADIPAGGFWDSKVATLPLRHAGKANILFCDGHVITIGRIGDLMEKNLYWNY